MPRSSRVCDNHVRLTGGRYREVVKKRADTGISVLTSACRTTGRGLRWRQGTGSLSNNTAKLTSGCAARQARGRGARVGAKGWGQGSGQGLDPPRVRRGRAKALDCPGRTRPVLQPTRSQQKCGLLRRFTAIACVPAAADFRLISAQRLIACALGRKGLHLLLRSLALRSVCAAALHIARC